jgi:hypothetical protein
LPLLFLSVLPEGNLLLPLPLLFLSVIPSINRKAVSRAEKGVDLL